MKVFDPETENCILSLVNIFKYYKYVLTTDIYGIYYMVYHGTQPTQSNNLMLIKQKIILSCYEFNVESCKRSLQF